MKLIVKHHKTEIVIEDDGLRTDTNYNLITPSLNPLYADITPKTLTISNPTASDKPYDGTTAAVISGTLVCI